MKNRRTHLIIKGKVQGVFFRASTKDKADSLGLTGHVKNLENGFVEVVAEGTQEKLDMFVEWCRTGPPNALVTEIEISITPPIGEFDNFHIQY